MEPNLPAPDGAAWPDLVLGAARGEPAAVDRWFRTEHPAVYRLAFGFLANEAEAQDAAQDAMLHLLDHLERWDPARAYGAWRTTVVLNLCRDRVRRSRARERAEDDAAEVQGPRVVDPGGEAERREVSEILQASLTSLSPREREVFVLRDLEGVGVPETARILDIGESTVRSLATLARRRLRRLLAPRLQKNLGLGGADG